MQSNLMKKFINNRRYLKIKIEYVDKQEQPYLIINDPKIIAGFAGYLKRQVKLLNNNCDVYYRGQIKNYNIIPSIFRFPNGVLDEDILTKRIKIYDELVKETPKLFTQYRFKIEELDTIFQHYGIRTPWIDLVDNIFTAIWFASNESVLYNNTLMKYDISKSEYGWIYFIITKNESDKLIVKDLRELHSSLSLRLHVQHGISAKRETKNWNLTNLSLDDFVIARVRFEINQSWFKGELFNQQFFFPTEKLDNTYKLLKQKIFANLIERITKKHGCEKYELGYIIKYYNS